MSSRLIARLLVEEYQHHAAELGFDGMRLYENFIRQESRTKGLRGRGGYQLAVKQITG